MPLFWLKKEVWVKTSSFEWKLYHFKETHLLFDDFLVMISEQENEDEKKKEQQIPCLDTLFPRIVSHFYVLCPKSK